MVSALPASEPVASRTQPPHLCTRCSPRAYSPSGMPVAAVASVRRCRRPGCAGSAAAAGGSPSRTPPARPAGRGCQPASPTTRWCSTGYRRRGRRPASAGARRPAPRTRNPPDGPARSTARH
ncbi:hypothetical protein G6F59_016739 [Rhizopus arrhizus]|nr:hypothetical protein G6F59_016739 [Rhizopus arrhizus]